MVEEYHDTAGHPGREETYNNITRLYYWPSVRKYVKTYVKHCLLCASIKRGGACQPHTPLRPRHPRRPWQTISMDITGPYPLTRKNNKFILVATDLCSKWVEARAVNKVRPLVLTDFTNEICQRWGFPEDLITDNGPSFRSQRWATYLRRHSVNHCTTPIYHQRANPVERRNQELKKLLRLHSRDARENRWDEKLEEHLFTLRNRTNRATGRSPSEVLLGAPQVRPGEWAHPQIRQRIENNAQAREERLRNVRRQIIFNRNLFPEPRQAPVQFQPGDTVLVRNFADARPPLGLPWTGPYPIVTVVGDNVYEVDPNGTQFSIHVDDFRPWRKAPHPMEPDHDLMIPQDEQNPNLEDLPEAESEESSEVEAESGDEPEAMPEGSASPVTIPREESVESMRAKKDPLTGNSHIVPILTMCSSSPEVKPDNPLPTENVIIEDVGDEVLEVEPEPSAPAIVGVFP